MIKKTSITIYEDESEVSEVSQSIEYLLSNFNLKITKLQMSDTDMKIIAFSSGIDNQTKHESDIMPSPTDDEIIINLGSSQEEPNVDLAKPNEINSSDVSGVCAINNLSCWEMIPFSIDRQHINSKLYLPGEIIVSDGNVSFEFKNNTYVLPVEASENNNVNLACVISMSDVTCNFSCVLELINSSETKDAEIVFGNDCAELINHLALSN